MHIRPLGNGRPTKWPQFNYLGYMDVGDHVLISLDSLPIKWQHNPAAASFIRMTAMNRCNGGRFSIHKVDGKFKVERLA